MASDLKSRAVTFAGVGVAAVLAAGVGYYVFAYKTQREHYFTDSRRRQLGVLAEQIENAINSRSAALRDVVQDALEKSPCATARNDFEEQLKRTGKQVRLAGQNISCRDDEQGAPPGSHAPAKVDDAPLGAPPSGVPQQVRPEHKALTIEFIDTDNVQTSETSVLDFRSTTCQGTPTRKRNANLLFCYDYRADSDLRAGLAGENLAVVNDCSVVCASANLGDIIDPFLRGDDFAAGNVFLGRDNKIRFESGSSDVRIGALPAGGRGEESKGGGATATPTPSMLEGPFPSAQELKTQSLVRDVPIGGEQYRLFSHPIYVSSEEQPWFLGFFVPLHDFNQRVAALSYGALSYLLLALPIALLAAPLLKIRTMGRRERLKAMDVRILAFSLIALAGAVTALGLAVYNYDQLDGALDGELESVSRQLQHHLAEELAHATAALDIFVAQYARDRVTQYVGDPAHFTGSVKTGIFNHCEVPERCDNPVLAGLRSSYSFFTMLIWSDRNAQQMEKWTVGDTPTPLGKYPDTSSYRDIKEGRLRELDTPNGQKTRGSFQLRFSPTNGKLLPVLWMPIERSGPGDEEGPLKELVGTGTIVLFDMDSLLNPTLPQGFGFAIIERDGKVVSHSDAWRSLYENFFEECDAEKLVRSAIESRGARLLSGSYHGRAQRFFVHPIEDSPWTLIVFRDQDVPSTVLLEGLLAWCGLYGFYLAVAVSGATLLRLFLGGDGAEWIWPEGDSAASYSTILGALIWTSISFLTVILERPGATVLLATSLALPLAAASHVYLRLAASRQALRRHAGPTWAAWIGLAVALFLVVWLPMHSSQWTELTDADLLAIAFAGAAVVLLAVLAVPAAGIIGASPAAWYLVVSAAAAGILWAALAGHVIGAVLYVPSALGSAVIARDKLGSRSLLDWRRTYGWAAVMLVVVVGVLPAAAFYQDVWDASLEVFVRHGQMKTAELLDRRQTRIITDYKARSFDIPIALDGQEALQRRQVQRQLMRERLDEPWDVVTSSFFGTPVWREDGKARTPAPIDADSADERSRHIAVRHFSELITDALPVYHDESIHLRGLLETDAADGRWHWEKHGEEAAFCWKAPLGDGRFSERCLRSQWPLPELGNSSPLRFLLPLGLLLAVLVSCYLIVRWLMHRILGVGELQWLVLPEPHQPDFGRGILLVRRSVVTEDCGREVKVIDLRSAPKETDLQDAIPEDVEAVLVKHLEERLEDLPSLESTRELLESLVIRQKRLVIVVSTVEPLRYMRRRLQSSADVEAARFITPEVIGRWARLLEQLMWVDADDVSPLSLPELIDWCLALGPAQLWRRYEGTAVFGQFKDETRQTPRLRGIGWEILWQYQVRSLKVAGVPPAEVAALAQQGGDSLSRAHPLERLQDVGDERAKAALQNAAGAHYRALWSHLTDDEQLLLVQLAKEGYVNPNGWQLINGLVRRGLVRLTPAVRLMNDSFRQFVASEETDIQVRHWETADGRTGWDRTRSIILIGVIAAGLILYVTQPERLTQMVGMLGAIGGAAVTVANLLGLFGGGRSAPAVKT